MPISRHQYKTLPLTKVYGRLVTSLRDLTTKGGTTFPAGTVFTITGKFEGYKLRVLPPKRGHITRVPPDALDWTQLRMKV